MCFDCTFIFNWALLVGCIMLLCPCSVNKVESNLILSKIIFLCVKIKLKPHMGECGECLQSWGSQAISQMKQKHVNEWRSGLQHEGRTGDQEVPTSYRAPRPASADAVSWPFEQVSGWSRRPTSLLGAITFHITRTLTEWKFPQRAPNPGVHTCQIVSRQPFESHYQSVARAARGPTFFLDDWCGRWEHKADQRLAAGRKWTTGWANIPVRLAKRNCGAAPRQNAKSFLQSNLASAWLAAPTAHLFIICIHFFARSQQQQQHLRLFTLQPHTETKTRPSVHH